MIRKTGITYKDDDGIEMEIRIDRYRAVYPYEHLVTKIYAEPTTKGKRTVAYNRIKDELGDDWSTDLTDCWYSNLPANEMRLLNDYIQTI